jgi:hypothetical protein
LQYNTVIRGTTPQATGEKRVGWLSIYSGKNALGKIMLCVTVGNKIVSWIHSLPKFFWLWLIGFALIQFTCLYWLPQQMLTTLEAEFKFIAPPPQSQLQAYQTSFNVVSVEVHATYDLPSMKYLHDYYDDLFLQRGWLSEGSDIIHAVGATWFYRNGNDRLAWVAFQATSRGSQYYFQFSQDLSVSVLLDVLVTLAFFVLVCLRSAYYRTRPTNDLRQI